MKTQSNFLIRLFALVALSALSQSCNPSSVSSSEDRTFKDFPKDPLADGTVSPDAVSAIAAAFNTAPQSPSGGPCISEPTFGALYPRNFTSPRIEWIAGPGQDIFELRFHIDNQVNDLVVYTDKSVFTLPDAVWAAVAMNSTDRDIVMAIRAAQLTSPDGKLGGTVFSGSAGSVHIAPVDAGGSIVYWTTSGNTALKGFRIGDRQVQTVLTPELITAAGTPTGCIGCHASSPDGLLTFFGRVNPPYSVDVRLSNGMGAPAPAGWITPAAMAYLSRTNQDLPILSKAHYSTDDSVVVTLLNNGPGGRWELNYTNLHEQHDGTGIIARTGDANGAAVPTWSHDGKTIVYGSSTKVVDGHPDDGNSDLWAVPYNNGSGGQAAPIPGVNDPSQNQYYPAFSPNDTLLAFNRNPRGAQMYNSPAAEVWAAPSQGGTPTRLAANDPPSCVGIKSPGLTNSWPRWSPSASSINGKHYYWLVFSSRRRPVGMPIKYPQQLFLSAVVTQDGPTGEVVTNTFPAIYIPTQPPAESNLAPVWDDFVIPAG